MRKRRVGRVWREGRGGERDGEDDTGGGKELVRGGDKVKSRRIDTRGLGGANGEDKTLSPSSPGPGRRG